MKFSAITLLSVSAVAFGAPSSTTSQKLIQLTENTSKCLGAASNADGAQVVIQDCPTAVAPASQLWTVTSSGTLQIFGNKCLDDTNGSTTNGQKLQIWTCGDNNKNQKWTGTRNGGIGLTGTNKCLDDTDGNLNDGTAVQIWDCSGNKNQAWNFVDAGTTPPPPTGKGQKIQPSLTKRQCLTAGSNTDGAAVAIQLCDGSDAQAWTVTGGTLQIFGNKCLDVPSGSTANGVKMQIYTCFAGNTNQKFTVTSDNHIAWTNKGQCLDLYNGDVNSGTAAQMWKCSGNNPNQVWNILS